MKKKYKQGLKALLLLLTGMFSIILPSILIEHIWMEGAIMLFVTIWAVYFIFYFVIIPFIYCVIDGFKGFDKTARRGLLVLAIVFSVFLLILGALMYYGAVHGYVTGSIDQKVAIEKIIRGLTHRLLIIWGLYVVFRWVAISGICCIVKKTRKNNCK